MATVATPIAPPRNVAKYAIWATLGIALVVAFIFTDYPLLFPSGDPYRAHLIADRFVLIPHAVFALIAMLIGPFQFSTRFRQRHLARHRLLGKIYVICIAFTAPAAIWLGFHSEAVEGLSMTMATLALGVGWLVCTLVAFLTARNRHIAVHRQWMVRSYCFTLNFIFARVLNYWPAYTHLSNTGFANVLWGLTFCYLLLPDLYFNWREITTSRAK